MKGSASKIQLAGFDDLFQTGGKAEANGEQVQEVPLAELFPFKDHPFKCGMMKRCRKRWRVSRGAVSWLPELFAPAKRAAMRS